MKNQRIYIRVSKEEKSILIEKANNTGLSTSDYVRKIVIKNKTNFLTDKDRQLILELKKDLRAAINLRNEKSSIRPLLDPVIESISNLIKKLPW